MDDRARIACSIGIGAFLGGLAGYLLFTERGRQLRVELEPRLNELLGEVNELKTTFERTRAAVSQGWQSFNELVGDQPRTGQGGGRPAWPRDASSTTPSTH